MFLQLLLLFSSVNGLKKNPLKNQMYLGAFYNGGSYIISIAYQMEGKVLKKWESLRNGDLLKQVKMHDFIVSYMGKLLGYFLGQTVRL